MVKLRSGGVVVARGHLLVLVLIGVGLAEEAREHRGEERLEARSPRPLFPAGERSHRVSASTAAATRSVMGGGRVKVNRWRRVMGTVLEGGTRRGYIVSASGGADINERACLPAGAGVVVRAAGRREGREERLQRSGRVRIATVRKIRSDGWDRSPGKLAVAASGSGSGIRLRAGLS
jgi:hypothetical protein